MHSYLSGNLGLYKVSGFVKHTCIIYTLNPKPQAIHPKTLNGTDSIN